MEEEGIVDAEETEGDNDDSSFSLESELVMFELALELLLVIDPIPLVPLLFTVLLLLLDLDDFELLSLCEDEEDDEEDEVGSLS